MNGATGEIIRRKARTRAEVAEAIARLSPARRRAAAIALAERVAKLECVRRAATIMAFLSLPTEIDTWPLIRWAWREGKRVAVPRIEPPPVAAAGPCPRDMVAVVLEMAEASSASGHPSVRPGTLGILEVPGAAPIAAGEIDVVLAPCMAVDRKGNRLGKGGGFYDRFLARKDLTAEVAVIAFHEQVLADVPAAAWDRSVGLIVTDAETLVVR